MNFVLFVTYIFLTFMLINFSVQTGCRQLSRLPTKQNFVPKMPDSLLTYFGKFVFCQMINPLDGRNTEKLKNQQLKLLIVL